MTPPRRHLGSAGLPLLAPFVAPSGPHPDPCGSDPTLPVPGQVGEGAMRLAPRCRLCFSRVLRGWILQTGKRVRISIPVLWLP